MEFFSTYYKKLANYEQIKEIGEKFNQLDADDDNALNKTELVNIFAQMQGTPLTIDEQNALMAGLDGDNDGFLNYHEFIPAFVEFDIDQDAAVSEDEFDFVKKRIAELEKQSDINIQYQVLNNLTATAQQKQTAQNQIDIFKIERNIIYAEQDIKKKGILAGGLSYKIGEIQQFINDNVLLPFDQAQKLKEIEKLEAEKDILLKEQDISQKKLNLENVNLALTTAQQGGANKYELGVLEQQKISKESELDISEKNLEQHYLSIKITNNQNLLTKFFVPEIIKDGTRKELEKQYDQQQLKTQRIELNTKTGILSGTRKEINDELNLYILGKSSAVQEQLLEMELQDLLDYIGQDDPDVYAELEALYNQQLLDQQAAQLSSLKVELIDKQIQLKEVIPRSNYKPFDQVRADLETEIADLQTQIAALEG